MPALPGLANAVAPRSLPLSPRLLIATPEPTASTATARVEPAFAATPAPPPALRPAAAPPSTVPAASASRGPAFRRARSTGSGTSIPAPSRSAVRARKISPRTAPGLTPSAIPIS